MIIVSDTSPLINLAAVGQLDLLRQLYGHVIIPQAIYDEIVLAGVGQPGSAEVKDAVWIETRRLKDQALADILNLELDRGEAEALKHAVFPVIPDFGSQRTSTSSAMSAAACLPKR